MNAGSASLSAPDEIKRTDALANTLFEVLIAVSVGAAAILVTAGSVVIRIGAFVISVGSVYMAITVAPDVVFAQGEPDLSDESLRKYLKKRQRTVQCGHESGHLHWPRSGRLSWPHLRWFL